MHERTCLTVILAAGEGTRMRSSRPKVLHEIAGLPILGHVLRTARDAGSDAIAVVVGPASDEVRALVQREAPQAEVFEQTERLGTGHAVLRARASIARGYDDVVVMFGDTPLVRPETLQLARRRLAEGAVISVVGFRTDKPDGYGRLLEHDGLLMAIREDRDCSDEERKTTYCNSGLMALAGSETLRILDQVDNDNANGEYYLTDTVRLARRDGRKVLSVEGPFGELLGINTQAELAVAEAAWQERRRVAAMLAGVSMQAPETVHFSHDTEIGADCRIEPNVWFGPGVKLGNRVRIRGFSHIEGATIFDGAEVGPFARLRPGARLGADAKVGNFCEIKQAELGEGAKVNHLTYIGDATIGARANIGAGTITCNYDGFAKYRTEIGDGAFIGSNTALVAPVSIGSNAIIGAGSVVTRDVPDDALALGRSRQTILPGKAAELNARRAAAGKKK